MFTTEAFRHIVTTSTTATGNKNMATANEYMASFKARHAAPKKPRKSAAQQVREERAQVIAEIRAAMIGKKREIPQEWERGFMAAVSVLEKIE
jgi:hypothetical protein